MIRLEGLTFEERQLYDKLATKLPESIMNSQLAIFVALYTVLSANTDNELESILKEMDLERASEPSVRSMGLLLGYKWDESAPLEVNRTKIKYFIYRRKNRGTIASMKNLIRSNATEEFYYNNNTSSMIDVIEDGATLRLVIPEDFLVRRQDINEVRPAGVILEFLLKLIQSPSVMIDTDLESDYYVNIESGTNYYELLDLPSYLEFYQTSGEIPNLGDDLGLDTQLSFLWNTPLYRYSISYKGMKIDSNIIIKSGTI